MASPVHFEFPHGKRFAFTIVDDTDVATVANVKPLYDLLHELGFRTTKRIRIIEHLRSICSGEGSS